MPIELTAKRHHRTEKWLLNREPREIREQGTQSESGYSVRGLQRITGF